MADLVHEYATCIFNKFHRGRGRPDIDTTLTTVRLVSDLPAATIITNLGPAQFEIICERDMVLPGEDMSGDDPDMISPTGTCIAVIYKILRHSSHGDERFVAVHPGEIGQPQYLGFGINAWHRGWVALLAFLERRLPTGSQNLFPNARKEAAPRAASYIFYDAEVFNANNDTAVDNAEPGNETRVHPTAVSIIAQAELYLKGPMQVERETSDDDEEEDVAGMQLADFQDRGMRTLVALNPGTNLRDAIRERCLVMGCKVPEPIEPSVMVTLLQYARDICSARVTDLQDLAETTRSFGTVVGTGDEERHAAGDEVDITDEDAVRATSIIAKMTEDDMPSRVSVERAMEALGKSDWKDTAINPNVPEFRVQYHQAVGTCSLLELLEGFFANPCYWECGRCCGILSDALQPDKVRFGCYRMRCRKDNGSIYDDMDEGSRSRCERWPVLSYLLPRPSCHGCPGPPRGRRFLPWPTELQIFLRRGPKEGG